MGDAAKPCLVSSLYFSSGVAVSMGEAAKTSFVLLSPRRRGYGEPQSLLFLWRRRAYRGSCKTSLVLLRPVSAFPRLVQAL